MKAAAAFLVFAGLGLILRYVLMEAADDSSAHLPADKRVSQSGGNNGLDVIVPGTSVAELLGSVDSDEEMT